jgi:hypothetical protein
VLIQVDSERKAPSEAVYSVRALEEHSRRNLHEWLADQHLPNPLPEEKLHCSVICACTLLPSEYIPDRRKVIITPETYDLGLIGPAFALFFECAELERQWNYAVNRGVEMVYSQFVPHISLSYSIAPDWNYAAMSPPNFQLAFVEEVVSVYDANFKSSGLH